MRTVSKEEYFNLTPHNQGYVCYMQAAWNKEIENKNPYIEGTRERRLWNEGNFLAMLEVQDEEE